MTKMPQALIDNLGQFESNLGAGDSYLKDAKNVFAPSLSTNDMQALNRMPPDRNDQ